MGKRKLSEWQLLVKKVMNENKNKPGFKFGDALKLAKKMYNPKNKTAKKGGTCGKGGYGEDETEALPMTPETAESPMAPETAESPMAPESVQPPQPPQQPQAPPQVMPGGKRKRSILNMLNKTARNTANKANLYNAVNDMTNMFRRKTKKNRKSRKGGAPITNTNGGTPYFSSN